MEKNRYKVKLNNIDKIEQLLQETYDLANQQTNKIQEEINKIANTTIINDLDIEGKEKYAKIMSNYISLQQKAIQQKFDISKLMSEVLKYNGDVNSAINDTKKGVFSFDISKIKQIAANVNTPGNNTTEQYQLKR